MDVYKIGALFPLLVLWHFAADWLFQTHKEALAKAKDPKVRAWHCFKYMAAMIPFIAVLDQSLVVKAAILVILFLTHYVIDSYVPVMLWAKYCRRAPQFDDYDDYENYGDEVALTAFANTPLGLLLLVTMDQFFHIVCLLPVAYLMTI